MKKLMVLVSLVVVVFALMTGCSSENSALETYATALEESGIIVNIESIGTYANQFTVDHPDPNEEGYYDAMKEMLETISVDLNALKEDALSVESTDESIMAAHQNLLTGIDGMIKGFDLIYQSLLEEDEAVSEQLMADSTIAFTDSQTALSLWDSFLNE